MTRGGHTRQTSLTALLAKAVGVVATAVRRAPFTWIHGAHRGNVCGYVAMWLCDMWLCGYVACGCV